MEKIEPLIIDCFYDDDLVIYPDLRFDSSNGNFGVDGSFVSADYFIECAFILEWLDKYKKYPAHSTTLTFRLDDMMGSQDTMAKIIKTFATIPNSKIIWTFYEEGCEVYGFGKELAQEVTIPFEFEKYSEE